LGVLGVALGTLIAAFLVRVVAQPFWVCKAIGLSYGHYMRFLGVSILRCGGLTCAVIAIASWGLRPSYPWLIASAICATALYAVGSWYLVFSQPERDQFLAVLTSRRKVRDELASVQAVVR
jgi:hypothetical protein